MRRIVGIDSEADHAARGERRANRTQTQSIERSRRHGVTRLVLVIRLFFACLSGFALFRPLVRIRLNRFSRALLFSSRVLPAFLRLLSPSTAGPPPPAQ